MDAQQRREYVVALRHSELAELPEPCRAEYIARHYIAFFNVARDLLELCDRRHACGGTPDLDRCIELLEREISDAHGVDLGIELAWRKEASR